MHVFRHRLLIPLRLSQARPCATTPCRRYAQQANERPPWRQDTTPEPSVFIEENFAKHILFVLGVSRRFFKFSLIGLSILGLTVATAYEGAHQWVEHVGLAPERDADAKKWEWDLEAENWTGSPETGGTDPNLGIKGRHIVRAAWMAYNWGVGYNTAVIGTEVEHAEGLLGPGALNLIDARLQRTEDFLKSASEIAERRIISDSLAPHILTELVALRASVLERLGPKLLLEAKNQYERVWAMLPGKGLDAARVASKLGDVTSRMGPADEAVAWWSRAFRLLLGDAFENMQDLPNALAAKPASPAAQRLLSSSLVSLSAFYAKAGHFRQAQGIEEASLDMLRLIPHPESLSTASPPQALHSLYLLQRSSLLSIHLAEVLHAQRKAAQLSLQWLGSAAESSERVAHALTGLPVNYPEGFGVRNPIPHREKNCLLSAYTNSRSMKKSADGLLRDARRTAAEAWNLMGILNESRGKNHAVALQCYERAIRWAGTSADDLQDIEPAEETLATEWTRYWGNYKRLKESLGESKPSTSKT